MTYIYSKIRTEIYETRKNNPLKQYRSFKELKKIFKWKAFFLFLLLLLCLVSFIFLAFKFPSIPAYIIPFLASQIINIYYEYQGEKIYNFSERQEEIAQVHATYRAYITEINKILNAYDISSNEKLNILINECENRLASHSKKYDSFKNNIFEKFIGVPIGAIITLAINNSDILQINQLLFFMFLGWILCTTISSFKNMNFYSEGYFKDRYLLSVLKEMQYNTV